MSCVDKIEDLMKLKEINTSLKIMVAIGGWDEGSANFSAIVNNDTRREYYVNNLVKLLDTYGFDGLDLDWEYPSQREGSAPTDKEKFVELAKELKAKFGTKGYLLTSAVPVTQSLIDLSYNVTSLSKYIDCFNLMLYDFHGSWDNTTGVNAPLYAQLTDNSVTHSNVNDSVHTWINNGVSASQLVLGMGLYGKTFTLVSLNDTATGAPVSGVGTIGPKLKEVATYNYYEIYEDQKKNARYWNITQVDNNYVYANNNTFWVGYDNEQTIKAKGQFAKTMGMAGVMIWAVDLDDFTGISGTKYPLIKAAIDGWKNN